MAAEPEPDSLEKGRRSPASVAADFAMGGAAAVVAKTGAAPVEHVKLLLQNQGELLRRGHLARPYKGIANAFTRVLREEGVVLARQPGQCHPLLPHPGLTYCFCI
jgi:solute carrier family 25 (mitochondrial adenine nucleotide translocator), member 4/5/6/31